MYTYGLVAGGMHVIYSGRVTGRLVNKHGLEILLGAFDRDREKKMKRH